MAVRHTSVSPPRFRSMACSANSLSSQSSARAATRFFWRAILISVSSRSRKRPANISRSRLRSTLYLVTIIGVYIMSSAASRQNVKKNAKKWNEAISDAKELLQKVEARAVRLRGAVKTFTELRDIGQEFSGPESAKQI